MRSNLKTKPVITDYEIETLILMRKEYDVLKEQMESVKSQIEACEKKIIRDLELGAPVDSQFYWLKIKEFERRCPSWKQQFIAFAGQQEADKVIAETEPRVYQSLMIHPED